MCYVYVFVPFCSQGLYFSSLTTSCSYGAHTLFVPRRGCSTYLLPRFIAHPVTVQIFCFPERQRLSAPPIHSVQYVQSTRKASGRDYFRPMTCLMGDTRSQRNTIAHQPTSHRKMDSSALLHLNKLGLPQTDNNKVTARVLVWQCCRRIKNKMQTRKFKAHKTWGCCLYLENYQAISAASEC